MGTHNGQMMGHRMEPFALNFESHARTHVQGIQAKWLQTPFYWHAPRRPGLVSWKHFLECETKMKPIHLYRWRSLVEMSELHDLTHSQRKELVLNLGATTFDSLSGTQKKFAAEFPLKDTVQARGKISKFDFYIDVEFNSLCITNSGPYR